MIRAYNICYLEDAMSSLGAMLDYAVNSCGEGLSLFYSRFLSSDVARGLYLASPKYIAGMSGIEMATLVARQTGENMPLKDDCIDPGSPEYWTGWTLAYLSWYLRVDYATLQSRGVTVEALFDRYPTLHEADLSKAVEFASERLKENCPLRRARRNAGLTQKELAGMSGITLRVIRAYEQGQRSLANAGAGSVTRLSRALGCHVEDLL